MKVTIAKSKGKASNNCGVIALEHLLGTTYEKAEELATNYFKWNGKGCAMGFKDFKNFSNSTQYPISSVNVLKLRYAGSKRYQANHNPQKHKKIPITTQMFVEQFKDKKYLVTTRTHAFVVDKGEIIGTGAEKPRVKVENAFYLGEVD